MILVKIMESYVSICIPRVRKGYREAPSITVDVGSGPISDPVVLFNQVLLHLDMDPGRPNPAHRLIQTIRLRI